MITLIEDNKQYNYKIYRSDVIVRHQNEMINRLHQCHKLLMDRYSKLNKSSTWLYRTYNIFSLVGQSEHFFDLYKDLTEIIKLNLPNEKYIWFQSWLNFHKQDEVLKWHTHKWYYHGYISMDPKNTHTVFRDYRIVNELGNIYIGPGLREHMVEVLEPYAGQRITLGFDVDTQLRNPNDLLSLIPIV